MSAYARIGGTYFSCVIVGYSLNEVITSRESSTALKFRYMHPLVRDLYKRAIIVGGDYPHPDGLNYVRKKWKKAFRDYQYPSDRCKFGPGKGTQVGRPRSVETENEKDLLKAVARGRYMVREMIGVIRLKKYRTMKQRY